MYSYETKIRVRYGETDKMGVVYYGNYPLYYEVARTEMIRNLGFTYRKLEESGIMMPVLSLNVKYIRPAYYDDLLTVKVFVKKMPTSRIEFEYEIYNEKEELLNVGNTVLVFLNAETNRPQQPPELLMKSLAEVIEH